MEITPKVEFLGTTFDLTVILGSLITAIIVFVIMMIATRSRKMRPRGLQTVMEMVIDLSRGMARMGHDIRTAEKYLAFTLTLFLFIFIANQLGVIMMVTSDHHTHIPALGITEEAMQEQNAHGVVWLKSPTADMNTTFSMAFAIAIFATIMGIRVNGFKSYIKHFIHPMGPLHLIEEVSKPTTHAMRLWANIFAGEVLITIMLTKGSIWITGAPLLVWMGFSLFVGAMQAYIFAVLANVYIGQKIHADH
jgi:F-type H+-transporting ATPase subunit a